MYLPNQTLYDLLVRLAQVQICRWDVLGPNRTREVMPGTRASTKRTDWLVLGAIFGRSIRFWLGLYMRRCPGPGKWMIQSTHICQYVITSFDSLSFPFSLSGLSSSFTLVAPPPPSCPFPPSLLCLSSSISVSLLLGISSRVVLACICVSPSSILSVRRCLHERLCPGMCACVYVCVCMQTNDHLSTSV